MKNTGTANKIDSEHLNYLQDIPLFDDKHQGKDDRIDQFKHSGYIESLYNLSLECPTPYCIGLFGGWGSGKTGIVKGLIKKGEENAKNNNIRFLYFDVWKHSADSLRRQLLIEIDKQWHNGKLNHEEKLYINTSKATDFKTSFSWNKFYKNLWWLIPLILAFFFIAYFQCPSGWNKDWMGVIGTAILPVIVAAIASIQSEGKTESFIEDISKPTSPEEFEKLFLNSIEKDSGIRNVFILDNLDRIDNEKVMEVLSGISTFLDEQSCIYIIPCDEKRLKIHLSKSLSINNEDCSHQDDFLRKLFNVQINLRPPIEDQIVKYVNNLLNKIGIQKKDDLEPLQTILVVGLSKNPRRVLQFLNNFVATYNLVYDIENQILEEASLPKGVISGNKGFLAKVIFIRDYFSEAFTHFESNIGSYNEVEEFIKAQQIGTTLTGFDEIENILKIDYEGLSLGRFLNATSDIRDGHPDLFFRLSGNTDIVIVESANDLINSLISKNIERANELMGKKLDDLLFIEELENQVSEILKSNKTSDSLKINLISTILQLNELFPDNEKINRFSGNLISPLPDRLLKKLGDELRPVIWQLASKKFIKSEKAQSIARIVYFNLNQIFDTPTTDKKGLSAVELQKNWSKVNQHLKLISEHFDMFASDVQKRMRVIVEKLMIQEANSINPTNEELWTWVFPPDNQIPKIFNDHNLLKKIASALPEAHNENTRNVGLLITKLHEYSKKDSIDIIIKKMMTLFNQEYDDTHPHLFPANIIKDWILPSNKNFEMTTINQLVEILLKNESVWDAKNYNLEKEWIDGFIELYDELTEELNEKILTKIINRIKTEPEEYLIQFKNSFFNYYFDLNYEALYSYASLVDLNDGDIQNKIINALEELLDKVFEYKSEPILEYLLQQMWSGNKSVNIFLSYELGKLLSREYGKIDLPNLIIKEALTQILNNQFWANNDDTQRESYIKPYLDILSLDKRLKQIDKDNILEPILKSFKSEIKSSTFKEQLKGFRNILFEKLSANAKKRVLNHIWTSYRKLTGINANDPDLSFLMANFNTSKEEDKREILTELLDQLNLNQPNSIGLFINYGLIVDVINIKPEQWLDEVKRYFEQNDDTNSQKLKSELSNKRDTMSILNDDFREFFLKFIPQKEELES